MSDDESFASLSEGSESLHSGEVVESVDVIFQDETTDEEIVIGTIRNVSASAVLRKRRKKTSKYRIPDTPRDVVEAIVRFMNDEAIDEWTRPEQLIELYAGAKKMQIESLVRLCVTRMVDAVQENQDDLDTFLGIDGPPKWEIECVWVYELVANAALGDGVERRVERDMN